MNEYVPAFCAGPPLAEPTGLPETKTFDQIVDEMVERVKRHPRHNMMERAYVRSIVVTALGGDS